MADVSVDSNGHFDELPPNWSLRTLGDLCGDDKSAVQTGPFGSQLHASDYKQAGIPVVNPTHLSDNRIDTEDIPLISHDDANRLAKHVLIEGDILIARRGDFSRFAYISKAQEGWLCGTGCMRIRLRTSDIDTRFLGLWFLTDIAQSYLRDRAVGSIMPNLNGTILAGVPIITPPLDEQRAMAGVLRTVRRAKEATEKVIAAARQLKQSLMRHLFTYGPVPFQQADHVEVRETPFGNVPMNWEPELLNDCCAVQTGVAKGRKFGDDHTVDLPYLRVANVQDGYLDLSEMKKITIRKREIDRFSLRDGDVVLTEGGDFDKLGRGFIWRNEIPGCVHQNHVFAVRADRTRLSPDFVAYQMQSDYGRAYFLSVAHRTTNLACINTTKLKAFPMLIPPLPEQEKITTTLQVIDRKIAQEVQELQALSSMFASLLHDLMTGQRRVAELELSEVA